MSHSAEWSWLSFEKFVLDLAPGCMTAVGAFPIFTYWVYHKLVMVSMRSQHLTGPARLILLHHCRNVYDGDRGSLGRPRKFTVEYLVDRIIYALRSGCPWRMLPVGSGSYKTIFAWFNKFSKLNVLRGRFMTLKSGIGEFGGAILQYMLWILHL